MSITHLPCRARILCHLLPRRAIFAPPPQPPKAGRLDAGLGAPHTINPGNTLAGHVTPACDERRTPSTETPARFIAATACPGRLPTPRPPTPEPAPLCAPVCKSPSRAKHEIAAHKPVPHRGHTHTANTPRPAPRSSRARHLTRSVPATRKAAHNPDAGKRTARCGTFTPGNTPRRARSASPTSGRNLGQAAFAAETPPPTHPTATDHRSGAPTRAYTQLRPMPVPPTAHPARKNRPPPNGAADERLGRAWLAALAARPGPFHPPVRPPRAERSGRLNDSVSGAASPYSADVRARQSRVRCTWLGVDYL